MQAKTVRRGLLMLAWAGVLATGVGFFLPWAIIDVRADRTLKQLEQFGRVTINIRQGSKTLTSDLSRLAEQVPKRVSGVQIPQLAHQEQAQVAIAVLELLTNQRQRVGLKSYAVYLVPGAALLCGVLLTWLGQRRAIAAGVGALCAVIAGAAWWKLTTTNTQALLVAMQIGVGLWLSVGAYAVMAVAAGLMGLVARRGQ